MKLSKREYFSIKILQGIISNTKNVSHAKEACENAIRCADELVEQLNHSRRNPETPNKLEGLV